MTISINIFELPKLTDEEKINGFIFNIQQTAILKIELVTLIQQLANFKFEPNDLTKGAIDHAYLNGQLEMLQTLLNRSEESQNVLLEIARKQAELQAIQEANQQSNS